jgi:hypothetical protein
LVHWQQLAFAYDVWQAAEQRKPTAHLPHPAAPMPTVRPSTALSDRTPCQQFLGVSLSFWHVSTLYKFRLLLFSLNHLKP